MKELYKPKDDSIGARFTAKARNRAYDAFIEEETMPIDTDSEEEQVKREIYRPVAHSVTIDLTDTEFKNLIEILERETGRIQSRIRNIEKFPSESYVVTDMRIEKLQKKINSIEHYISMLCENTF